MQTIIEVSLGTKVAVRQERGRSDDHVVSVYSCKKNGTADLTDQLYSESTMSEAGAYAAFQKIVSTLEKGEFPWEIVDPNLDSGE